MTTYFDDSSINYDEWMHGLNEGINEGIGDVLIEDDDVSSHVPDVPRILSRIRIHHNSNNNNSNSNNSQGNNHKPKSKGNWEFLYVGAEDSLQHFYLRRFPEATYRVCLYGTHPIPGAPLRHAVTGARYAQHRFGSKDEARYFSVIHAVQKDSLYLFFDSPAECERYMHVELPVAVKEAWFKRQSLALDTGSGSDRGAVVVK